MTNIQATWKGRPLDWGSPYPWYGGPLVGGVEQRERRFRWTRLAWWWRRPVYRSTAFRCWTDGYVWECPVATKDTPDA